jgi:hypothetical protein
MSRKNEPVKGEVEQMLDLSFVRDLVEDCYACLGRPNVGPMVYKTLNRWDGESP